MSSVWGVLNSFLECFSVLVFFSHPPLPFFIIFTLLLLLPLLFLLLFVITVIIISIELLALCDGCLDWGWVWRAGARGWVAGRAGLWGALATRVGVSSSSPQVAWHPTSICDAGVNF